MAPQVSYAKLTLPFPIFAAEFDPYRPYLVVGGGGGEGRSGVPNQLAAIDCGNRAALDIAAEIDLSREEDSVQSLASLATKDGLITFAGVNSSQANQNAGKNEHLRSFEIKYPPKKRQKTETTAAEDKGSVTAIGKRALFKPTPSAKSETYQRLLRLSPAQKSGSGAKRIGAVATGLSKSAELVVFNATTATPSPEDVIARIEPDGGAEPQDLDLATAGASDFSLAYCTDYDICEQSYEYDFAKKSVQKTPKGPRRVYQMPYPDASAKNPSRSKYRCLRFLDPQNLVALVNRPNRSGAELHVIHLYPTGPANLVLEMRLPSHLKQGVSMDVCALDTDKHGNRQIAVAIAGQDISLELYTLNYTRNTDTFSRFKHLHSFRDVHPQQMTKICFSPFHSPPRAPDPEPAQTGANGQPIQQEPTEPFKHPGPQYIRLASVSYGNTVVVDTFPLSPLHPKDKDSRYVLSHPSDEARQRNLYYVFFAFIALMIGLVAQSYFYPDTMPSTGLTSLLPPGAREYLNQPANVAQGMGKELGYSASSAVASGVPSGVPGKESLQDLLSAHLSSNANNGDAKKLVVRDDPTNHHDVSITEHLPESVRDAQGKPADETVRHWDELDEEQKRRIKAKLINAGRWVEAEGEKVLKGVLWSSYAGLVGQVGGEILREL